MHLRLFYAIKTYLLTYLSDKQKVIVHFNNNNNTAVSVLWNCMAVRGLHRRHHIAAGLENSFIVTLHVGIGLPLLTESIIER